MRTQNGWPVLEADQTRTWKVPSTGGDRTFRLAKGDVGFLLTYLADWHHDNIEPIDKGQWDDWGYAVRKISGSSDYSNHGSGAIDLNAVDHPMGVRNTYSFIKRNRIRVFLRLHLKNVLGWGGDYRTRPDDMHYEVIKDREAVQRRVAKLKKTKRGQRIMKANL